MRSAGLVVSIVLVAGLAFVMSACGARSSLPVPPNVIALNAIAYASFEGVEGSDVSPSSPPFPPFNIWVVDANGSSPQQPLTSLTASLADSEDPAYSPDGTQIAFESARSLDPNSDQPNINGVANIWVMNADGTGAHPLTKLTASEADTDTPVWSPKGDRIAFASNQAFDGISNAVNANGVLNIWVTKPDDPTSLMHLTKLDAVGADSLQPVWSPDGTQIAFASRRDLGGGNQMDTNGVLNIWVVNADGSGGDTALTKLTASGADSLQPVWSPKKGDNRIAFTSGRALDGSDKANTARNIWVINANGDVTTLRHLTNLTASGAGSDQPVWSPDGTQIAFASNQAFDGISDKVDTNGVSNIWVMNPDDPTSLKPLTQLTASLADSRDPVWSPNGDKIAFSSQRSLDPSSNETNNSANIWVMSANGSGAMPLTHLIHANCFSPTFSPLETGP
jgi:Tol biopolymer transport system component